MRQAVLDAFREAERTPASRGVRGEHEKPSRPELLAPFALGPWSPQMRVTMPKYISRQHFIRDRTRFEALPSDCPSLLRKAFVAAWQGDTSPLVLEASKRPHDAGRRAWACSLRQSLSFPTVPNAVRWQLDYPANEQSRDELCRAMQEAHAHICRSDFKLAAWTCCGHELTDDHKTLWRVFLKVYGRDPDEFFEAYRYEPRGGLNYLAANPLGEKINGGARRLLFRDHGLDPALRKKYEKRERENAEKLRRRLDSRLKRKRGGDQRQRTFPTMTNAGDSE